MNEIRDHRPQETPDVPLPRRRGWQFSLFSLLVLTTLSAAVLALLRPLALPPGIKLIGAGYAILLAAYILLRGVALWRESFRLRRQIAIRRRELEAWLEDKRTE
jgi:hypothetical protein